MRELSVTSTSIVRCAELKVSARIETDSDRVPAAAGSRPESTVSAASSASTACQA
jgi:hypothetical protein